MRTFGCYWLVMVLVALLAAGCNLDSPVTPLPSPAPTQPPADPGQIVIPAQPDATTNPADCTIPPGWRAYEVVPGDNLTLIASTIDSTVEELVAVNCLANPDALFVGQTLYLPRLPGE